MSSIGHVLLMTSTPKCVVHNVPKRSELYELRIRGWSARPTGLRSGRARQRKNGGSHGLFTMPCEVIGGGPHAAISTAPLSSSTPGGRSSGRNRLRQQSCATGKATGIETVRRSRTESGVSQTARMPGRRNGSILSLVNRAVKSDIFLNGWNNR